MKSSVFINSTIVIVILFMVAFFLNSVIQAQSTASAMHSTMVYFGGDPMSQHGLQIQSWCTETSGTNYDLVYTVPFDRKFIVTDIVGLDPIEVHLLSGIPGIPIKVTREFMTRDISILHTFSSGIVFEPNTYIYLFSEGLKTRVTISGYLVDL